MPRPVWILVGLLAVVLVAQQFQIRGLRDDLKNSLVSKDLLEKVLAAKQPIVVPVPVPGGGGATSPVTLNVLPAIPPIPAAPGQPAQPGRPPRLEATTAPVPCRTEDECRRIFGASQQSISVLAAIRIGTVVPVVLNGEVVNLPLAREFPLKIDLVLSERGVFHALEPAGSPLRISQVRTETRIDVPVPADRLPYHLGLEAGFLGSQPFIGAVYVNRAWSGFYRVAVGAGPGFTAGVFFTIPLR